MAQLLRPPVPRADGERGAAMVVAAIVSAVVFGLGAVWVGYAEHATTSARYERRREQAIDAAGAGLVVAAAALERSRAYPGVGLTAFPGGEAAYEVEVGPEPGDTSGFRYLVTATGYAPGPSAEGRARRALQQVVELDPVAFEHAILIEGNLVTGSASSIVGGIYSNGNITFGNSQDHVGDVYSQGNITTGSNQTITGDLHATGSITIGSASSGIDGSAYAGGGITTSGRIEDDAVAGGNVVGCAKVGGRCSPQSPPAPIPVQHIPSFTWSPANYAEVTEYETGTAMVNALARKGARGAHYLVGNVTFGGNDTLYLTGDLTLVVTGNVTLPRQVENRAPGGTPVQLSVISSGGGSLIPANNFTIPSTVRTLMYTAGNFVTGNSATFTGVLYASNLTAGANLAVTHARVDDVGFSWVGANPQSFTVRNVSIREVEP